MVGVVSLQNKHSWNLLPCMLCFVNLSTKFHDIIWCALKKTKHVINSFSFFLVELQFDIISEFMVSMYV